MKIVCYSIKHLTSAEQNKFQRELHGFKDISNNGKYVYKRQGLLNQLNHKKIYFTGVVVKNNLAKDIVKLLKKHKAKIHITSYSM